MRGETDDQAIQRLRSEVSRLTAELVLAQNLRRKAVAAQDTLTTEAVVRGIVDENTKLRWALGEITKRKWPNGRLTEFAQSFLDATPVVRKGEDEGAVAWDRHGEPIAWKEEP
jgi:hypothetical protein